MDNHRIDAHLLEQHDVSRKPVLELFVGHGVAAVFDDHGFAMKPLDIGQGFRQDAGDVLCGLLIHHHSPLSRRTF